MKEYDGITQNFINFINENKKHYDLKISTKVKYQCQQIIYEFYKNNSFIFGIKTLWLYDKKRNNYYLADNMFYNEREG